MNHHVLLIVATLWSTLAFAETEVSARPGYFAQCKIASTGTAGEKSVSFEVISAAADAKWHPHIGLTLTDTDDRLIYKISVPVQPESLLLGQAQQMFNFTKDVKDPMHVINVLENHTPAQNGRVEFRVTWNDSGLFMAFVDGIQTGRIVFSRKHQAWNIFVSGVKVRVDAGDADLSQCVD